MVPLCYKVSPVLYVFPRFHFLSYLRTSRHRINKFSISLFHWQFCLFHPSAWKHTAMFVILNNQETNSKGKNSLDTSTLFNFNPISLFSITTIILKSIFFYSLYSVFLLTLSWPFAVIFKILNPMVNCQYSSYWTISSISLSFSEMLSGSQNSSYSWFSF